MITRERIELNLIDDNPWQPRVEAEPTTVGKLADSIRGIGLLQAPTGRRTPEDRVQLAFGTDAWRRSNCCGTKWNGRTTSTWTSTTNSPTRTWPSWRSPKTSTASS